MSTRLLSRGDVWRANLDPTIGHEQAGVRPVVIVSMDRHNRGPARLLVVVPVTTTDRRLPLQVAVDPPEGGLRRRSFVMCENVRAISTDRLISHLGTLSSRTMALVDDRLRVLVEL